MRGLLGRLRQGRFVAFALIAMGGAALSAACSNHCPDFESPCPEPFDVGKWCASEGGCTMDGASAECDPSGYCELDAGTVFAISLGGLTSSFEGRELFADAFAGGCETTPQIHELWATIDGVPGTFKKRDGGSGYFSWDPFPTAPQRLEVGHGSVGARACMGLELSFVDSACESENPEPECSL